MSTDGRPASTGAAATRSGLAGTWALDASGSHCGFAVRDKLVARTTGTLPATGGGAVLDDAGVPTSAWVDLDTAGVDTGLAKRDEHLRGSVFLDAASHPVVRVEVGRCAATPGGWTATATVRARGASAPVELAVEPTPADASDVVVVRVTGRLDRAPLGIKAPSFVVGRYLDLDATLAFTRS